MNHPPSHKRPTNLTHFYYGSPYYPEHWDADTRANDPERMAAAGWNMVRMAEFAWDRIEPYPGQYNFALFDETIQRMGEKGIVTMLCTPTATPPRWLTYAFPEMLRVDANGVRMQHGARQHACYSNESFRHQSRRITRAMAEHYRENPYVVGWQTDNEINCHMPECHCDACQEAFRAYLLETYSHDIEALNAAWGAPFWAQTYADFDTIETPRQNKPAVANPSQLLDYYRFQSWMATHFQHDQVEILREVDGRRAGELPRWFVTHNGMFRHIDYRGPFTTDLDFIGYDVYPFFDFRPSTRPSSQAYNLDQARAWSGNFFIPEQQSGPGGQNDYIHDTPEPGEMRRMAYTSIARGADGLLFFRWRTARYGAEEYWCGVLDHDNVPRRRYHEAAQLGEELRRVGPAVLGTSVHVTIGIAASDQVVYDAHTALPMGLPAPQDAAREVHRFFLKKGYAVGCVHPSDDLADLQVYVIPHWAVFDPQWVANLTDWVNRGGVLVIGARTATKTLDNHVSDQTPPGVLARLAGIHVAEWGKQNAAAERPLWVYMPAAETQSQHWYEVLEPQEGDTQVETLATWKGRHLNGLPAVSLRRVGQGAVMYAGTCLTGDLLEGLLPEIERITPLTKLWPFAPEGVQVTCRKDAAREVWFFINTTDAPAVIEQLPAGSQDLIHGGAATETITLAPNDVAVLETKRTATPGI
jgi:beta-galactosidase